MIDPDADVFFVHARPLNHTIDFNMILVLSKECGVGTPREGFANKWVYEKGLANSDMENILQYSALLMYLMKAEALVVGTE